MFAQYIFAPWFTGVVFLVAGLIAIGKRLLAAEGLDKLILLGPVFVAASLAAFGAEHLGGAKFLAQMVPPWMPAHLFWAYFVGLALVATGISLITMKYVRWSGVLLSIMLVLFVLTLHVPRVMANPADRFSWAVALRDLSFAAGALAFAATQMQAPLSGRLITIGRLGMAIPMIFFSIEHFLHPEFTPSVPLEKITPPWIPLGPVWGYLTGVVLLVAGAALLVNQHSRIAAVWSGTLMVLIVLFIYVPILSQAGRASERMEGINYVFDTLLYGGTLLLLAASMPRTKVVQTQLESSLAAS